MNERIVLIGLISLCVGQVLALIRGRECAVFYYLCVAPLSFFSVWRYTTLGPDRLCGILLITGIWAFHPRVRDREPLTLWKDRFSLILVYGILTTVVAAISWPIDSMTSTSPFYRELRVWTQAFNWAATMGVAWVIGNTLSAPGAFRVARKCMLVMGALLCLYGLYQYVAYSFGLPATGTRYVGEDFGFGKSTETFTQYERNSVAVFRVASLLGEPKHLAACCVLWLALALSSFIDKEYSRKVLVLLILLIFITLWFTASTSGWISALCCGALAIPIIGRWNGSRSVFPTYIGLVVLCLFGALLLQGTMGERLTGSAIGETIRSRLIDRLGTRGDLVANALADGPEQLTIDLFISRPNLAIFGVGQGGLSFYLAEMSGGSSIILFPNNGVLGFIGNMGIVGICLLCLVFVPMGRLLAPSRANRSPNVGAMALVGVLAWIQICIFPSVYLIVCACGFLLSAGFVNERFVQTSSSRNAGMHDTATDGVPLRVP